MLSRLLIFLAVIFAVESIDLKNIFRNYPELQKCVPTFKMLDASGKLPSGLNSGNFIDLGHFDQCLGIDEKNNKSETIKGKYCLMKIVLPTSEIDLGMPIAAILKNNYVDISELYKDVQNIQERVMILGGGDNSTGLFLGWCIPHICPIDQLSEVLSNILREIDPEIKIKPVNGGVCQTKDDIKNKYNAKQIILLIFLAATLSLMLISTFYDMYVQHHKKKPAHIILIAFSVKTNGKKLLSISNNPDQLPCLNGIRFISMMWVVFGHSFLRSAMEPITNMIDLKDWLLNPANIYIINASVSVDSFLVLSGMLLAYSYCLAMDKGVKFNIILFYLHRYLRLTPVLAVLVWIHATILGYFGSGPFWPIVVSFLQDVCIEYWWSPLVYAQNYYNTQQMCISQTWYLAVDMQLFILSPIILIPLWKWPKRTLLVSVILVLGSMASSFAITYVQDLPVSGMAGDSVRYLDNYYYTTHTRYGPWLMGIMLGYYVFKLKKSKNSRITLHPAQVTFGWIISMGLLLSSFFVEHGLILHPDKLNNSLFNGLYKHGWSLGICWVIYACTQGYGGPINAFLSWSVFQIMARFTYTVYLVHYSLQYLIIGTSKTSSYFSDFNVMYKFWGDFMFSLAISVYLTLAYESPMITIEKLFFKMEYKPKKPELSVYEKPSTLEGGQGNNGFVRD